MRFLADSSDYYDYLKGINNLTDSQKQVLYERLKSELPMTQSTPIQSLSLPTTANTTIRAALPDSDKPTYTIDCCLHCGSTVIKKIGKTKGGMQRYLCKDCHKSFTENYGLITHYSHLSEWQWQEAVRATVVGISLTELAKNINVSTKTAWLCRMKIYDTLKNIYGYCDTFNSIVEADGKYERISFKGCKDKSFFIDKLGRLPRHHRSRAQRIAYLGDDYKKLFAKDPTMLEEMIYSSQKRMVGRDTIDINHQHVCILTAIDRSNNIYVQPVSAGSAKSDTVYENLQSRITREAVLVTDEYNSYKYLCRKESIEHIVVNSKCHSYGTYSLSRINALHSSIDRFLGSNEYKPATKYLDLYFIMFWWLEKNKDVSQIILCEQLFNILLGRVSYTVRSKMMNVTQAKLSARPLPIGGMDYY